MRKLLSGTFRKTSRWIDSYRMPNVALRPVDRVISQNGSAGGVVQVGGWDIEYVNATSLRSMLMSLVFQGENDFASTNPTPYILDCGSNIGVSVLRYKQLFPNARIVAFEPDTHICRVLRRNLTMNKADDVTVVEAAVWVDQDGVVFHNEGTVSGHIVKDRPAGSETAPNRVASIRLADYLAEPVDFIKLDIEGAELAVLRSCAPYLRNVEKMVVEVHYELAHPTVLAQVLTLLAEANFQVSVYCAKRIDLCHDFKRRPGRNADQHPILYAWH